MVFTSLYFLIFFPLLAILYWCTSQKYRLYLLLFASYYFYINTKPIYALLLATVTISTFLFTNLIERNQDESKRKAFMIINIILILLPLFFFKYFGAINDVIFRTLLSFDVRWPLPEVKLLLPVGISFYSFVAIGYTIDVYNEDINAEKNFGIVALFISFFPLILSGPIERAKNLLPQFAQPRQFHYDNVVSGIKLMLWGYFMKLVVADRLGIYIDAVFQNIPHHNGITLLLASLLYPFQVYSDLGGYSLIAIGTARIMGYTIIQNFQRPFCSTSMGNLWRRWHISLISWLTDYVYTPLSFSFRKFKIWGIVFAIFITFVISGIWHGAAWTFVVWGIIQSIYLSIEALTAKKRAKFEQQYNLTAKSRYIFFEILLTYLLFTASQIFGRVDNINEAFQVYKKIFSTTGTLFIGDGPSTLIYCFVGLLMILFKDFTDEFIPTKFLLFQNKNKLVRIIAYTSIFMLILLIGVFDGGQFIYFKF